MSCTVQPISGFLSTNLNSKINTLQDVGTRIKRQLGWPLVSVEIHQDQLYDNIAIATELFSKFAGSTQEYIIFDSNLYTANKGIRLDILFTAANAGLTIDQQHSGIHLSRPGPAFTASIPSKVYVATSSVLSSVFTSSSALSSTFSTGINQFEIFDHTAYSSITAFSSALTASFTESSQQTLTQQTAATTATSFSNVFDYDIMDYRKVISVTDFEEGSTTGINTLFTLEQTLAQQTYFSYALGNQGFDLVSWFAVKEWLDLREKLLATRRDIHFDPRTQYLQIFPQPNTNRFYGVLACWVERPLRDLMKEQWIFQYALALSKITVGRVRGKFTGVSLLGGGSFNYDLLEEGRQEKEALEKMLYEGASPGMGSQDPCMFFVG